MGILKGGTYVGGELIVATNLYSGGNLNIENNGLIGGSLNVSGQTTLVNLNTNTSTPTNEYISGLATVNNLTVTGLTNVGTITPTTLNVSGLAIINNLTVTGTTNVGTITPTNSTVSGTETVNALVVTGTTTLRGNTTIWAPVVIDNNLNVTGSTTLGVTSAPTISTAVLTTTATTGTAPLVVSSQTVVNNLNADLLDGNNATYFVNTGRTITINGSAQNLSSDRTWNVGTITSVTINAISGLTGGGTLTGTGGTINIGHTDVSSASGFNSNNSNGVVIQDIQVSISPYGHVTGTSVGTIDLDGRYYTETEADNRFVNVTGDTISGDLNISGITSIGGNTFISGTLNVTESTDFFSQVNFRGGDNQFYGSVTFNNDSQFGSFGLTSSGQIKSTIAGQTAALVIPNTVKINNLNSDLLDGYHSYDLTGTSVNGAIALAYGRFVELTGDTMTGPLTIATSIDGSGLTISGSSVCASLLRNDVGDGALYLYSGGSLNISLDPYEDQSYFLKPLSIGSTSTTGEMFKVVGNTILSGNTNMTGSATVGSNLMIYGTATGTTFRSTITNGTAPLYVNSSTLVANLNTDMIDGIHLSGLVQTGRTITINGSSQNLSSDRTWNVGTITSVTINAISGLTGGGTLTGTGGTINIGHTDVSSASGFNSNNSNGVVIQDIQVSISPYGHVTGTSVGTIDLDTRYYTETEADNRFLNVAGDTMGGALIINNTLNVTGQTNLGNLNVNNVTPTNSTVSGTETVNTLIVTGTTTLRNNTTTWAPVIINNSLDVTGITNFTTAINTNGGIKSIENIYTGNKTGLTDGITGVAITKFGSIEISGGIPFIDFHFNNSTDDYTTRIAEGVSGQLGITGKLRIDSNPFTANPNGETLYVAGDAYNSGKVTASSFVKSGSTNLDVLMGDGSTLQITSGNTWSISTTANKIPVIKPDGVMEIGKFIDFHEAASTDYTTRLISDSGIFKISNSNVQITSGSLNVALGLTVGDAAQFNTTVYIYDALTVEGATTLYSDLTVNSNIYATGEITPHWSSDIRLKKNINSIQSGVDVVNKLNPVTYNWNDKAKELNSRKTDKLDSGLIAQELELILPNLVGEMGNGYKTIDYVKLIPYLIAAIKEQQIQIDELKLKFQ